MEGNPYDSVTRDLETLTAIKEWARYIDKYDDRDYFMKEELMERFIVWGLL